MKYIIYGKRCGQNNYIIFDLPLDPNFNNFDADIKYHKDELKSLKETRAFLRHFINSYHHINIYSNLKIKAIK